MKKTVKCSHERNRFIYRYFMIYVTQTITIANKHPLIKLILHLSSFNKKKIIIRTANKILKIIPELNQFMSIDGNISQRSYMQQTNASILNWKKKYLLNEDKEYEELKWRKVSRKRLVSINNITCCSWLWGSTRRYWAFWTF